MQLLVLGCQSSTWKEEDLQKYDSAESGHELAEIKTSSNQEPTFYTVYFSSVSTMPIISCICTTHRACTRA